jgi:hypothetical protein
MQPTTLDLSTLYAATGTAKLAELDACVPATRAAVPPGDDVTLTGPVPVWMYRAVAHALHGCARLLAYASPVTGPVRIFDHNPPLPCYTPAGYGLGCLAAKLSSC